MKTNVVVRFLAVVGLLFSMHSIALPEMNPYKGLVLAEGENETALREQALKQVLIKVSGNTDIIRLDESDMLTKSLSSMLSQFGYQTINNQRFYYVLFDKSKINRALTEMQQPIWGETRPTPLIWLVNENRKITSEYMIKSSQDSAISWGLKKSSVERGVHTQFPLIDLDDSLAITASDINGRFYQTVADASKRYDAEYFVLANITKAYDKKWRLRWELIQHHAQSKQNKILITQNSSGSKSHIMSAMLNDIADYYAQQFAILENNGEKLTQMLTIKNIDSLAHLTVLNNVLKSLNAVDTFTVVRMSEQQVEVLVTLKGGLVSLRNALNVQPHLQSDLLTSYPFHYNWQP